ncbi:MAG: HPr family phosphocarrier protein [Alkalispirochaeta sp.]
MSVFRKKRSDATPRQGDYDDFLETVITYTEPVLRLCHFAFKQEHNPDFPCRDYLGHLHRDASTLQELLDLHGAQTNRMWFPFRESIAAAKNFSSVTYDVLHVRQAIHRYQLLDSQEEFADKTDNVLSALRDVVFSVAGTIIDQTQLCGVHPEEVDDNFAPCIAAPLDFRLPTDREVRHVDRIGEQIVYLATQFLNLSEDADVRAVLAEREGDEYQGCIPYPISEERMRTVEARFHNLQSLYDTYIFESDLEQQNEQIRYLRGHISIIYHLLSIGTDLVHYYIRHMSSLRRETYREMRFPMDPERLRDNVFEYPLRYAREYMESAVQLCRSMIQAYSEQAEITVPIPNYRGFHVRPSTLVARIVLHYGSKVTMHMDDQEYDASAPMDLFRANEAINRIKRRRIAAMLSKLPELQRPIPEDHEELVRELQLVFVRLMNAGQIIMYDTDLSFDELNVEQDTTMADLVARAVRHFMSIAKVDVQSDITVRFVGDSRALKDLEILAKHGYGEDRMGNNVVLPNELSYLSRG